MEQFEGTISDRLEYFDTRYNRQKLLPEFGKDGQDRLASARVAVVGAGGVKSPLLYYLVAAGVGTIRIIDFDRVELSNLNRQILFTSKDIGINKAEAASKRLKELNNEINIEAISHRLDKNNIDTLFKGYDIIVEGGDSLSGRELVNSWCVINGVPFVHASAEYHYGYVLTVLPRKTACFNCVFPDLPARIKGSVPVLGVATGIIGVLAADEVLKLILGTGKLFTDGIMLYSGRFGEFRFVPSPKLTNCKVCS